MPSCSSTSVSFTAMCGSVEWDIVAGEEDATSFTDNVCTASDPNCYGLMVTQEKSVGIMGIVTDKSGTFGCQLDDNSVQWFFLEQTLLGQEVYL
ncbi:hypothetical protein MNV49_005978 [Pseudohyphozyma bogoriensis]|nr:hypothetical protein MNV49_005978 [Pseudohyphozyma bogoriensis]